ncbi:hypothetical protein BSL78_10087 [Apostichopus japonicus]|uniref:Uncharacterized protein n=1 Tax=Stichopus japonicus TaxID=307972 RepID=A0A2G8KYC4_STIJA|nr:hypothetical protein BSL78_10087 [Apostichopus japonicus]
MRDTKRHGQTALPNHHILTNETQVKRAQKIHVLTDLLRQNARPPTQTFKKPPKVAIQLLYRELTELWAQAGMSARKWLSNSKKVRGFATPLAVMAARRDSKIVLLSFSGEAKVVPVQVFSVLRSVGLKVPGEVDALQRKPLRGMNCFDVRFTSEAARVRGVHVLEAVSGTEDRSYAARVATGVVEAVPVPASDTVHMMLLSSPQCPTLAPRWRLCSPSCPTSPLTELAETASLPTEAEQDKTAEMVLAEWHAAQDAACTGSPVATPAIGDTSRAPSQPAQETLSGPDSNSPMEDCTTALLVVAKESSDWFDETKQVTDLIDSSGPSTLPAAAAFYVQRNGHGPKVNKTKTNPSLLTTTKNPTENPQTEISH